MNPRLLASPWCSLALALLVASSASATPGDNLTSEASVICTAGDRVALLFHSVGNAGTYYITDNRWHLVMIDTATREVQWRDHGAVVVNTVNVIEDGEGLEVTYRDGDAPPLGVSLAEWGMIACGAMDATAFWGATALERFGVEVSEAGVSLTFGERRRELEISGTWDPSELAADQFHWIDAPPETLQSLEPISSLADSEGLELVRTLPLETRTVFLVDRLSEFGNHHLVIATPRAKTTRAMAWLVNARGLDDHRAGHPELSTTWFLAALKMDQAFETARFNLACALALQGNYPDAIRHLKLLPQTAELKAKIAADKDFDPIRAQEEFEAYVQSLP